MKYFYILCFLMIGCATPYKPDGFAGGFSETWFSEDAVSIVFRGNQYTKDEKAYDFALLRAAELGAKKGYSHMALVDSNFSVSTKAHTTSGKAVSKTTGQISGTKSNYGAISNYKGTLNSKTTTTYEPPATYYTRRPKQSLVVVYGYNSSDESEFLILETEFIIRTLTQKHKIELD